MRVIITRQMANNANKNFYSLLRTIKYQQLDILRSILAENNDYIAFKGYEDVLFAEYTAKLKHIRLSDNEIFFVLVDGTELDESSSNVSNSDLCYILELISERLLE